MEKEFIPFEQALALKELGFDEPCFVQYKKYDGGEATLDIGFSKNEIIMQFHKLSKFCSAPLYQQAFRWFREKHELHSHVRESYAFDNTLEFVTQINGSYVNHGIADKPINRFETYEEAELECLKKLIEIVKEK